MSSKSPWVAAQRLSDSEIDDQIQKFLAAGKQIIELPEDFNPEKKNSETAIKLGKPYLQVLETQKKS